MGVRLRPEYEDAVSIVTPRQIQGKVMLTAFLLTATVWCTMSSYRLDRLLVVIFTCKFCRGCAMQFRGNGATSGCITITHRLLCSNSCHHPATVLSGSRSELRLAVPCFENGPQGDAFRNHGGHQTECDGRTSEDSKRSLPPVLPTMAGWMEQVCARARILL